MEELSEKELEKVSGGHGNTMKADCPFCNSFIFRGATCFPNNGASLGTCSNGHSAVYVGGFEMTVRWTNPETNETRTSNFHS